MTRSVDIMRRRVDKLGVAEPDIRTQGSNQIVIDLPGIKDPAQAMKVIGSTAQLQLFDLETSLVSGISVSNYVNYIPEKNSIFDLLQLVKAEVKSKGAAHYYLVKKTHRPVQSVDEQHQPRAAAKSGHEE